MQTFAVFTLDTRYYALPYEVLEKIIRAVEITPLSESSQDLVGIINLQGNVIPVLNIRQRLGLHEQLIEPQNYIMICQNYNNTVAFIVDEIQGLIECSLSDLSSPEQVTQNNKYLEKIAKQPEKLIFILSNDILLMQ